MLAEEILNVILDKVEKVAKVKTILGDPIQLGDVTVIPVCKVGVGFGAGGGENTTDKGPAKGGGGGGGFSIEPIAFLAVKGGEVSLLPVKPDRIGSLAKAIPLTAEKVMEVLSKSKEKSAEKE
jgi:uncharacterized spore protein YtfJ